MLPAPNGSESFLRSHVAASVVLLISPPIARVESASLTRAPPTLPLPSICSDRAILL